jgi:hypothetical protein
MVKESGLALHFAIRKKYLKRLESLTKMNNDMQLKCAMQQDLMLILQFSTHYISHSMKTIVASLDEASNSISSTFHNASPSIACIILFCTANAPSITNAKILQSVFFIL